MARVTRVDNSRKEHICGRGNHPIPKGDSYYSAAPGFRSKPKFRCLDHPFRPSELTASARSGPLSAVEAFEDAARDGFNTIEDLQAAWDELGEALQEYVDEREQALEAWEHGNSQLEELRDTAQEALDEFEAHSIEDWTGDDEPEDTDSDEWGEWEDEHSQHVADQTDEALSVAGGLSL
jgi:acyl-CoA reductase-like NAD-dependent aldehyde dehydrogenase